MASALRLRGPLAPRGPKGGACRQTPRAHAEARFIRGPIEPDQLEANPDGSLVVIGDVARGAQVSAAGDIVVWGRLQGRAHAGMHGDAGSVMALAMQGAQLQVGNANSLGNAKVTLRGPHVAVATPLAGRRVLQLQPWDAQPHPTPSAMASSFLQWIRWYPASAAALFTGLYATLGGALLLAAPKSVLSLLFDASAVSAGWIQVGGVLFATFGMQYLGAALGDWRSAANSRMLEATVAMAAAQAKAAPSNSTSSAGGGSSSSSPGRDQADSAGNTSSASSSSAPSSGADTNRSAAEAGVRGSIASASASAAAAPPWKSLDLLGVLGELDVLAHSSTRFYQATVWSRLLLAAAFVGLVVCGHCGRGLLVLAALNAYGALSMARALQHQQSIHSFEQEPPPALL